MELAIRGQSGPQEEENNQQSISYFTAPLVSNYNNMQLVWSVHTVLGAGLMSLHDKPCESCEQF